MDAWASRPWAALLAILLVTALAAACSDRDAQPVPTPTVPLATATPTPTQPTPPQTSTPAATPTPSIDGVELRKLKDGPLTRLEAHAVVVESGCWACDGPPTGLVRYYEAPDGTFRQDALFRGPVNPAQYITGVAFRRGTQQMAVTVCTAGYCGRVSDPTADAAVTLFESLDGGITWDVVGQYPGAVTVAGFVRGDWLLVHFPSGVMEPASPFLAGSGQPVEPPPGARLAVPPRVVGSGELLWVRDDGRALLRDDGTVFFETPLDGTFVGQAVALDDLAGPVAVAWFPAERSGEAGPTYLTILEAGSPRLHLQLNGELLPWHWANDHRIIGNAWERGAAPVEIGTLPVVIDLQDATIRPLDGPFGRGQGGSSLGDLIGRNFVLTAFEGPFARVLGPACTSVVDEPGGASLGCFAPGVILAHQGTLRSEGGRQWLRVRTPAGDTGWASTEFLEW
ncbi:MAG: hypothetical protein Kow0010_16650 [Dehalococcoidia bacterium]